MTQLIYYPVLWENQAYNLVVAATRSPLEKVEDLLTYFSEPVGVAEPHPVTGGFIPRSNVFLDDRTRLLFVSSIHHIALQLNPNLRVLSRTVPEEVWIGSPRVKTS